MDVENSETRQYEQLRPQNVAAGEYEQIGRPLLNLRKCVRRILIFADREREAMHRGNFADITKYSVVVFEKRPEIRIVHCRRALAPLRDKFPARIARNIPHAPLAKLAQHSSAIESGKRESADGNVSRLGQAHGHCARGFAIHTGAQNYDAHGKASRFDASNERVKRCSSRSASAKNLEPQLM